MNTTESLVRVVTAACVSVLLSILTCLPVLAQDAAEAQPTPESPLRTTLETGLSVSAWRVENHYKSPNWAPSEFVMTCPAAVGTTTRVGLSYRVSQRAEIGGFMSYDMSRPVDCTDWIEPRHQLHSVVLGPSVSMRPLAAPNLFFRLGVGATWQRGEGVLLGWTPRGVGASADVGYDILRGPRATLFVAGGMVAGFGFDSIILNRGTASYEEVRTVSRSLAGTLRLGATLR